MGDFSDLCLHGGIAEKHLRSSITLKVTRRVHNPALPLFLAELLTQRPARVGSSIHQFFDTHRLKCSIP